MKLADLLSECFETNLEETWERKRTVTPVRVLAVQLHATGCSLREIKEVPRLLGVEWSHQAVWQWIHRLADSSHSPPEVKPERIAVDETVIKINGEWSWLYAAIDIETRLILDVELFGQHGTDPTAALLHRLSEKHDLSKAVFLVDGYGYQTALSRLGLSGRLDYVERNLIENGFTSSRCELTASIIRGRAITGASASYSYNLRSTITFNDRVKRSTDEHRLRKSLIR